MRKIDPRGGQNLKICFCRGTAWGVVCEKVEFKRAIAIALKKVIKISKYNFKISGDVAEGKLPDGTSFLIDKDMVSKVSEYNFRLNWKGYVQAQKYGTQEYSLMLHWVVLGFDEPPNFLIDHINRNKTDCRRENLRIVTNQQNCMNRGIGKRNKTGFLGTFYNKKRHYYMAKICISNNQIYLLRSNNHVECAKAYNYASELLFKEFAGYRNPVDDASDELKKIVFEKCKPYLAESDRVTTIIQEGA